MRGKALPRGNQVEEGTERLRSPTECDPEGRQRGDVLRAMQAREPVAAHSSDHGDVGFGDHVKQPHSALVNMETTSRDRTTFLSTRAREHDCAGHTTAESSLGMLDVQCKIRAPSLLGELRHNAKTLNLRNVETTQPLRGNALFDERCDLTDADTQEATVRACRSSNPGIIIVCIPWTSSKSHLGFCTALCTWQQERVHHDLHRLRGDTSRGAVLGPGDIASERGECLARTGSQTNGTIARLDSTVSAMSRARVHSRWQHTFSKRRSPKQDRCKAKSFAICWKQWYRKSLQPREAICSEIARHGRWGAHGTAGNIRSRSAQRTRPCRRT